jgi:hypothetical protein
MIVMVEEDEPLPLPPLLGRKDDGFFVAVTFAAPLGVALFAMAVKKLSPCAVGVGVRVGRGVGVLVGVGVSEAVGVAVGHNAACTLRAGSASAMINSVTMNSPNKMPLMSRFCFARSFAARILRVSMLSVEFSFIFGRYIVRGMRVNNHAHPNNTAKTMNDMQYGIMHRIPG